MKERGNNLITLPIMLRTMMRLVHEAGLGADDGFTGGGVDFYFEPAEATRPIDEFISVHLQPAFDLLRMGHKKLMPGVDDGHYSRAEWEAYGMSGGIVQLYEWEEDRVITRINILRVSKLYAPDSVSLNAEPQLQEAGP